MKKTIILFCIFFIFSTSISKEYKSEKQNSSLGFVVAAFSKAYKGKDVEFFAFPSFQYKFKKFYIQNLEFGINIHNTNKHSLALFVEPDFSGFEEKDNDYFKGMDKREKTANLGIKYNFKKNFWKIETVVTKDILNKSKGTKGKLQLSYFYSKNKLSIIPGIGLEYLNSKYTNYYYGVSETEATNERPLYSAKSSINRFFSTGAFYRLKKNTNFIFSFKYNLLGKSIKDSPLTERKKEIVLISGISWKF